jgi:hypothetical protein
MTGRGCGTRLQHLRDAVGMHLRRAGGQVFRLWTDGSANFWAAPQWRNVTKSSSTSPPLLTVGTRMILLLDLLLGTLVVTLTYLSTRASIPAAALSTAALAGLPAAGGAGQLSCPDWNWTPHQDGLCSRRIELGEVMYGALASASA